MRGKLEVAGNEGHEQAGKTDRAVVPLQQNPLAIGSVSPVAIPDRIHPPSPVRKGNQNLIVELGSLTAPLKLRRGQSSSLARNSLELVGDSSLHERFGEPYEVMAVRISLPIAARIGSPVFGGFVVRLN